MSKLTIRLKFGMSFGLPTFYRRPVVAIRHAYFVFDGGSTVLAVAKQTGSSLA